MKRLFEVLGTSAYPLVFRVFGTNIMNTIVQISKTNTMKVIIIVFSYNRDVNTIPTLLDEAYQF